MESPKLDIKLENEKHSFIIEERDVSKIKLIYPFIHDAITFKLTEQEEELLLQSYDQIASYCLGSKKYMTKFYSLNPLTKTVKIIVPKNSIRYLSANLENGDIFLKNVSMQKAKITCIRGNIKITDSSMMSLAINGFQSNVSIKNLESNNCLVTTKAGDISLEELLPRLTMLKTEIGDIKVSSEDNGIKNTLFNIESKHIQKSVAPTEELQKVIRCVAPYGSVDVNVL